MGHESQNDGRWAENVRTYWKKYDILLQKQGLSLIGFYDDRFAMLFEGCISDISMTLWQI